LAGWLFITGAGGFEASVLAGGGTCGAGSEPGEVEPKTLERTKTLKDNTAISVVKSTATPQASQALPPDNFTMLILPETQTATHGVAHVRYAAHLTFVIPARVSHGR
jgi:hypothetical protein